MKSYLTEIDDLLIGETPRQKYEWLESLIKENAIAKGRIDYCRNQFEIIKNEPQTDPFTRGWCKAILETLSTPI